MKGFDHFNYAIEKSSPACLACSKHSIHISDDYNNHFNIHYLMDLSRCCRPMSRLDECCYSHCTTEASSEAQVVIWLSEVGHFAIQTHI